MEKCQSRDLDPTATLDIIGISMYCKSIAIYTMKNVIYMYLVLRLCYFSNIVIYKVILVTLFLGIWFHGYFIGILVTLF